MSSNSIIRGEVSCWIYKHDHTFASHRMWLTFLISKTRSNQTKCVHNGYFIWNAGKLSDTHSFLYGSKNARIHLLPKMRWCHRNHTTPAKTGGQREWERDADKHESSGLKFPYSLQHTHTHTRRKSSLVILSSAKSWVSAKQNLVCVSNTFYACMSLSRTSQPITYNLLIC